MLPILFCFPILSSSPGYVCCIPTHRFLQILSITLLLLLIPVLVLNTVDSGDINLGFWAMQLFILGTIIFISFGMLGLKKFSSRFITVSFTVWLITYFGFLLFATYSIWTPQTLEVSSINGRCPMTIWLFDWCCKARGIRCNPTKSSHLQQFKLNTLQDLPTDNTDPVKNITSLNEKLLKHLEFPDKFYVYSRKKLEITYKPNITEFILKNKIESTDITNANHSVMNKHDSNKSDRQLEQTNIILEETISHNEISQDNLNQQERYKRDVLEIKVDERYPRGAEYRNSIAALLGTLSIMGIVLGLYTLYAVALNDVLNVLTYASPIIFVTRIPADEEGGAVNTQQQQPKAD